MTYWLHPSIISVTSFSCFCFQLTLVGRRKPLGADEDDDCVTQVELRSFRKNITEVINVNHALYATTL
jgi:hypothetical protein